MKILLVCTGNTCRSPMAEGLLKNIAKDEDIDIISGGIYANENEPVSRNAVLALLDYNINIKDHTAKNINAEVVNDADLILTMTKAHKDILIGIFGSLVEDKIYTLLEYIGQEGEISDPFGKDLDSYRTCAKMLDSALITAYEKIRGDMNDL